jgi:hypothetical protein
VVYRHGHGHGKYATWHMPSGPFFRQHGGEAMSIRFSYSARSVRPPVHLPICVSSSSSTTHIRPVSSWPWTAAVLVILILLWIKGNFSCNCCLLDEYTYQKRTSTGSTTINFSSVTPISAVSGKQTFREFGT